MQIHEKQNPVWHILKLRRENGKKNIITDKWLRAPSSGVVFSPDDQFLLQFPGVRIWDATYNQAM